MPPPQIYPPVGQVVGQTGLYKRQGAAFCNSGRERRADFRLNAGDCFLLPCPCKASNFFHEVSLLGGGCIIPNAKLRANIKQKIHIADVIIGGRRKIATSFILRTYPFAHTSNPMQVKAAETIGSVMGKNL